MAERLGSQLLMHLDKVKQRQQKDINTKTNLKLNSYCRSKVYKVEVIISYSIFMKSNPLFDIISAFLVIIVYIVSGGVRRYKGGFINSFQKLLLLGVCKSENHCCDCCALI